MKAKLKDDHFLMLESESSHDIFQLGQLSERLQQRAQIEITSQKTTVQLTVAIPTLLRDLCH